MNVFMLHLYLDLENRVTSRHAVSLNILQVGIVHFFGMKRDLRVNLGYKLLLHFIWIKKNSAISA